MAQTALAADYGGVKSLAECRPLQMMIARTAAVNGMDAEQIEQLMHEETRPDPVICPHCGALLEYSAVHDIDGEFMAWMPMPDPCTNPECVAIEAQAKRKQEMRERMHHLEDQMQAAGIPILYRSATLKGFRTEGNPSLESAKRAAYELLRRLGTETPGERGILLCGPVGTGKTHIATAIVRGALLQNRYSRYVSAAEMMDRIKRSFGTNDESVVREYCNATLLVIDDLGKEHPSAWSMEQLMGIIDIRYRNRRPTVYTTNLRPNDLYRRMVDAGGKDMASALISRVKGTSDVVQMAAADYRMRGNTTPEEVK